MSDEPTIPTAPTTPAGPLPPNGDEADNDDADDNADKGKSKGGRPSNKELAGENKRLADENVALRLALSDLAAIPDDPTKKPDDVLYVLSRGGVEHKIHARDLRNARKLLSA